MFKKPTKKQLAIRRAIISTGAAFMVLVIVTIAVLFMLGYRLDSGNGRFEQGALLQFGSTPNGADVWIDGQNIGNRTATKRTVLAGTHTIRITRANYEDWSRTLNLDAGTLTWLDYIRLVPKNRPVEAVAQYESLAAMSFSPDYRWALALPKADNPAFQLIDLRSEEVKTSELSIKPDTYSDATTEGVSHTFSIVRWTTAGRYVLVKHAYADKQEWILLDTENADRQTNITRQLGASFKDIQFAGSNGSALYGVTDDGVIRKLDLSASTMSGALVSNVDSFHVYDNTIITFIGRDPARTEHKVAGLYRDGDEAPHILRTVESTDTVLHIATSRYFGDDYVAIAEGNVVTILKGRYPASTSQSTTSLRDFAELETVTTVTDLSFSPGGDYVVAQAGAHFVSYEIEYRRSAMGGVSASEGEAVNTLQWLDDAHLWSTQNNALLMRDFDGTNVHSIMAAAPGFDASISQNGRFFYAVGKTDKGFQLQRVKMVLD